jgi:uncharacterized protein YdiU (UPF0061 family)
VRILDNDGKYLFEWNLEKLASCLVCFFHTQYMSQNTVLTLMSSSLNASTSLKILLHKYQISGLILILIILGD